jgi:hypothetical protein
VQLSFAFQLKESILIQLTDHDTRIGIERDLLRARCPDYRIAVFSACDACDACDACEKVRARVAYSLAPTRPRWSECGAPLRRQSVFLQSDGQTELDSGPQFLTTHATSDTAHTHAEPCAFAAHLDCEPALFFSFPL